jgi:ethanolamine kinase
MAAFSVETVPAGDEAAAKRLCIRLLPGWSSLDSSAIASTPITNGITNTLWKLSPPAASGLTPVVLRVFGFNTELVINREKELLVLRQLAAQGFGAPLLACFRNGRVEGWLDARPLEPAELTLPSLSPHIAASLRAFHSATVDEPREPTLWRLISDWLATATELLPPSCANTVQRLRAHLAALQPAAAAVDSPVVICHNDLLSGNILLEHASEGTPSPRLHLIDFEYAAYNPRGFDIGNHWNEWAGFECDYSRYPSLSQQRAFLLAYASGSADGSAVPEEQMQALLAEGAVYSLVSHLYWGVWALVQSCVSKIDFDFRSYAGLRLAELDRRAPESLFE